MEIKSLLSLGRNKILLSFAVVFVLLIAIGLVGIKGVKEFYDHGNIGTRDYQAVFLTNGQVYFGKLSQSRGWLKLTDIYYLQATQQLQPTGTEQDSQTGQNSSSNIQLIKLGSELHGPEDVMYLEHDKILFWENMKEDSKVMQAIGQYQQTKK